jgi:hypothetical protein
MATHHGGQGRPPQGGYDRDHIHSIGECDRHLEVARRARRIRGLEGRRRG